VTILAVTKAEQVCQATLKQIFAGVLKPGQRLVEARLSKELGVSQATVNAALQDLHSQGVVNKLLNRSTWVRRYTRTDIEQLFAVRLVLEPAAAEAAARHWSGDAARALRGQVDEMRRASRARDIARFSLADYSFHQEIYRQSRNSFLQQAGLAIAAAPFAYILCDHPAALPPDYLSLAEDHQDLILALEEGPHAAARLTRERIEQWLDYSLRALDPAARPGAAVAP
jgi:DNA-binding GntR family transcriptional regulator